MKTLSVLVWTEGLKASYCMRFQTKTHLRGQGRLEGKITTLHVHPSFLYTSLPFLFLNLDRDPVNSSSGGFAYF